MTDTSPSAQTATRGKRWRAAVPLATQMTRQTWRLLLAIGLGLSLAVMLAGAVPLFARVAITVGLRSFLTQNVDQANYRINGYKDSLSDTSFAALNATVTRDAQDQIGSYLRPSSLYDITTVPTAHLLQSVRSEKFLPDTLTLRAVDPARYAPLLHVVAGRLPAASSASIEVAITQDTAGVLNIPVQGFTPQTYAIEYTNDNQLKPIPIVIVGVIASPVVPNAQLWFDNTVTPFVSDSGFGTLYGLVSRSTIFAVNAKTFPPSPTGNVFIPTYGLYWYQETDPNSFSSDTLSDIQARFDRFQDRVVNDITNEGGVAPHALSALFDPDSLMSRYAAHITSTQIPITLIFLGILGSALLFVSLLADILVERQSGVIAVLRSRGFSRWQIFGALAVQSVAVCLGAFVLGALFVVPTSRLLAFTQLPATDQSAVASIGGNPLVLTASVVVYLALIVVGALAALLVAMNGAMRLTVLAARREATRTTHVALWQRLNLDVVALIIAVVGLGVSLYIQYNVTGTDAQIDQLLVPVALLAPIFALLALGLLVLRGSRVVLRLAARGAQRGRGALGMLAVTQVERAPRQFLRLALFLSLALAYGIFALAFSASQAVRANDVAAQLTGADYSGVISAAPNVTGNSSDAAVISQQTSHFSTLAGVTAASVGYVTTLTSVDSTITTPVTLIAVDAPTYAQTAVWPTQDQSQPLPGLIRQLVPSTQNLKNGVPAIVDSATWADFNLAPGRAFSLKTSGFYVGITFIAVAQVPSIPQNPVGAPGVLVDLSTFAAYYTQHSPISNSLPVNQVWLRTQNSAATQVDVRAAISQVGGPYYLYLINDRRALRDSMQGEPLTLTLLALLLVGVSAPLVLALIATLIAAWQNVRQRLVNLALLCALGATPRQLLQLIAWEQSIVFGAAVMLGAGIGALFALTTLPNLIFTDTPLTPPVPKNISYPVDVASVGNIFQSQHVPPVRVIFPSTILVAMGILLVVGAISIAIMVAFAARASLSQSLRLNED